MIRTPTTLIVGAGANREIEMPDGREMLNRIAAGFDFDRLGTQVQTRDMVALAEIFEKVAPKLETTAEELQQGGRTIRTAAAVSPSVEAILEQLADNPHAIAAGKIALVYYTLQAEAKSTLAPEPREPGELPLRGQENWLFRIGMMMVSGVPRSQLADCFYKLSIVSFTYDRSIEHFLPWVLTMAYDMDIEEAQQEVGLRLRIVHPLGTAGRLPWQDDEKPKVGWGDELTENYGELATMIQTASQRSSDPRYASYLRSEIEQGRRLAFLGFDFDPMKTGLLFEEAAGHNPDVFAALTGFEPAEREAIARLIINNTGLEDSERLIAREASSYEILRDNAAFLES